MASITIEKILAPSPTTTRGQPTQLSSDPSGQRLAYASGKSIFIRSLDNPSDATQYRGHTAATTVARFSPNGYKIGSGDVTGVVRVWEPATSDKTRGEYAVFSGRINDIAWDGDAQRLIAVGEGREFFGKAIMADSGNSVGDIMGHAKPINAVALRQARPIRAVTVGDDGAVCFLHGVPFAFKTKESALHSGKFVLGAAYAPDGGVFVTVGADSKINVFDGKEGTHLREIGAGEHSGSIMAVSFDQSGRSFVTASADRTVRLWDLEAGKTVQTWQFGVNVADQQLGVTYPHGRTDGLIVSLSLSGDLNYLAAGTAAPTRIVQGHSKSITALGGCDTDELPPTTMWTGSYDGRVCQWDVDAGKATTVAAHTNKVVGFANADGRTWSVGWDDKLRLLDATTMKAVGRAEGLSGQPQAAADTLGLVYIARPNGVVVYLNVNGEFSLLDHRRLNFTPTCIATHDRLVALGGCDNTVKLYETFSSGSLTEIAAPANSTSPVTAVAFSPDGKHLATGNSLGKIYVYETNKFELVTDRWSAHTARVTSIAWEAGGKHAASGSLDTNVYVWCLDPAERGTRIKAANAHMDGVTGVRWVGKTRRLVSVGADAALKLWTVSRLP